MRRLFRQFSFPGGIPSHVAPETPGSIHEGGELGYALAHAYGAAFDNPDLLVCCVVGDGEAETGPLAASWHSNKFLDPRARRRGAADPAPQRLQDRQPDRARADPATTSCARCSRATATSRSSSRATTRPRCTSRWPPALDARARRDRATIQRRRARAARPGAPRWPMIVLRTPKGWTGPKEVDGMPVEGTFRSHQVPLVAASRDNPEHLRDARGVAAQLPARGAVRRRRRARAGAAARWRPAGDRRMGANPHANGGALLRDLELPDFRDYAVDVPAPATSSARPTRVLGALPARRDAPRTAQRTSGSSGPTRRRRTGSAPSSRSPTAPGMAEILPGDDHLAPDGRVMEVLSEHLCQGWLEGYLLTGRHGLFNCYEAFIHIVDSMFNQHAKWLKVTRDDPVAAADRRR